MEYCQALLQSKQNIEFSNQEQFNKKIQTFYETYKSNKESIAIVFDFDLTITTKYNYETGSEYQSSYYFYDEDVLNGETNYYKRVEELRKIYADYEFNASIDEKVRQEKTKEWYIKALELYQSPKFTLNSLNKMIQARKRIFQFRKFFKDYFDLIINMEIPIIIESGGVGQFIEGALKLIIPDLDEYIKQKKIVLVSNELIFDGKDGGCIGFKKDIIYAFNKAESFSKIVEQKFPNLKKIFIFGDHTGDADCISKLKLSKDDVTSFGFLNIRPDYIKDESKKDYIVEKIIEYKNSFDVVLVGDADFQPLINLLNKIKNK